MNSAEADARLQRWADAKALPPVYAQKWRALDEASRTRLLEIAEKLKMHTGQFIVSLVLLEEIAVREGQLVCEILNKASLVRVLNSGGSGPGRARALLDQLRLLRYPRLERTTKRLLEAVSTIGFPPGIKIILPRDLASAELRVEIVAHGRAEMEELLSYVEAKSDELARLAGMLSGTGTGLESNDSRQ
jgi:hypothetical protein